MNRKAINRIAATVMVCWLLPAIDWPATAKSRPSVQANQTSASDPLQPPEVAFDSPRGQVTVRVSPRHLQEVRIPFPLRERLAIIENGVRQPGVSISVEHSPISIAVLIENGGRSHQLNDSITSDAGMLIRPLLDVLDNRDRLGVFAYDESVRTIVDFDTPPDRRNIAFGALPKPRFSEANFYDASLAVIDRLAAVTGRKALLVVSTGIDTFSRTAFADVVARAKQAKVPVYVLSLGELARRRLLSVSSGLLTRVDWDRCEQQLERLAEASGGRAYLKAGSLDVQGIYDEIIEDLKVRYVLTYAPSLITPSLRKVQVAVLDPAASGASGATGQSRRHAHARVIAEATYRPADAAATGSAAADRESKEVKSQ
jgi:Ca-activated chloride channel homolog